MDQLQHFIRTSRAYAYLLVVLHSAVVIATYWSVQTYVGDATDLLAPLAAIVVSLVLPLLIVHVISSLFVQPLQFLWQAILYIAPESHGVAAPDISKARHGKALVANLVRQVYQLADVSKQAGDILEQKQDSASTQFLVNLLPLPVVMLDKAHTVVAANHKMEALFHSNTPDVTGKNIYSLLDLSFQTEDTLDSWLTDVAKNDVAATKVWRRVKVNRHDDTSETTFIDLAAYYNKANPAGYEVVLAMFDQTVVYRADDQAVDFVSLAVHELRTPLTMLRGYIELIEEEVAQTADAELKTFLQKTDVAASQLTAFVNNILNVARIEDGQMILKLEEARWQDVLTKILADLNLYASVYGITIKQQIAPDLPTVGIDRVSLQQVVTNLVDNAIKYSNRSREIVVSAKLSSDGLVETTVQDFGVGIPQSAIQKLFVKFYRDHRNKQHVGGTGLGLYLCKMIIEAHDGTIWVRSKEGEGSTFGFALLPYSKLADERKNSDNTGIIRNAHGWIKNHSLYRR